MLFIDEKKGLLAGFFLAEKDMFDKNINAISRRKKRQAKILRTDDAGTTWQPVFSNKGSFFKIMFKEFR